MAAAKKSSTPPPLFRVGDRVEFDWGVWDVAQGEIIEDRGILGAGGRRLYGIRFRFDPGEEMVTEMPEDELRPVPPARSAENTKSRGRE
jgi:hypothetical protein